MSDTEADDVEAEFVENPYPWADTLDEWRRCFVFEHMANSDIEGPILVKNMQAACEWLKSGAVSSEAAKPRQRSLVPVSKNGD